MKFIPAFSLSLFICVLTGCGGRSNPTLERAQFNLREAKNDPQLMSRAPTLVEEASSTLEQAERTWKNDGDRDRVEHLVYLSERKLDIAREEARRKQSSSEAALNRDRARSAALELRASANEQVRSNDARALQYQRETEANRRLIQELRAQVSAIESRETERGLVLTLSGDVLFESGSSNLKPGSKLKLSSLADFLKSHPDRRVVVEGHTDSTGTAQFNRELSQRRADAVRVQLITDGVEPRQIESIGLGQEFPVASNQNEAGRLQNRRVQIVLPNQDA